MWTMSMHGTTWMLSRDELLNLYYSSHIHSAPVTYTNVATRRSATVHAGHTVTDATLVAIDAA